MSTHKQRLPVAFKLSVDCFDFKANKVYPATNIDHNYFEVVDDVGHNCSCLCGNLSDQCGYARKVNTQWIPVYSLGEEQLEFQF